MSNVNATCNIVRGINGTLLPDRIHADSTVRLAWTNYNFKLSSPELTKTEPIEFLLRLLMSTGTHSNGNYDEFEGGIGLGIPESLIDIASFTDIQAQPDWDSNQRIIFHVVEPQPAKEFIENEICRPFGLYLRTGNDGKIRCVRPKHPQKFHFGAQNQNLSVNVPSGGSTTNVVIPIGLYTAEQIATRVTSLLGGGFSLTYDRGYHRFTLANATSSFDLVAANGWASIGWGGTLPTNVAAGSAGTVSGAAGDFVPAAMLTKNDMSSVTPIDNRDDQIAAVMYKYGYDVDTDNFGAQWTYSDPETASLGDNLGPRTYVIESKGLFGSHDFVGGPITRFFKKGTGCDPIVSANPEAYIVDAPTWSALYAAMLLDRYKQPPLKFSARLKWEFNNLEIGDVVRVSYDIPGVLHDYERNLPTIDNRLFEIVELHHNFEGSLDVTFLGHRYVSY